MDWKDLLKSKIDAGELPVENSDPVETAPTVQSSSKKDVLHVLIDRKGRKGKTATIIEGFSCSDEEVADIAARLKTRLGTGGSSRGGEILLQGDRVGEVRTLLAGMGYKVK